MTRKEREEVSLMELLVQLEEEMLEELREGGAFSEQAYECMRLLGQRKILQVLGIINSLLVEEQETGIIKQYTKGDLLERLPWKKSQLTVVLQKLVREGILFYHKRRYQLNSNQPLVQRVRQANKLLEEEIDWEEELEAFAAKRRGEEEKEEEVEERAENEQPNIRRLTAKEVDQLLERVHEYYINSRLHNKLKEDFLKEFAEQLETEVLHVLGLCEEE